MKALRIILLLVVSSISISTYGAHITINMATEGAFYPWNFCYDLNGQVNNSCTEADLASGHTLAGYDIDIGNTICSKFNQLDPSNTYNCVWKLRPWSELSMGVSIGSSYDMIIAQMVETDSRKSFANFVGPYLSVPEVKFIVPFGSGVTLGPATKVSPRPGKLDCPVDQDIVVGVQQGTIHKTHMDKYCTNPVLEYATIEEIKIALLNHEIEAMISITAAVKDLLGPTTPQAKALGDTLFDQGPSIALSKTAFGDSIQSLLKDTLISMYSEGIITQLEAKWTN